MPTGLDFVRTLCALDPSNVVAMLVLLPVLTPSSHVKRLQVLVSDRAVNVGPLVADWDAQYPANELVDRGAGGRRATGVSRRVRAQGPGKEAFAVSI